MLLPELYAIIASYVGEDKSGDFVRELAENHKDMTIVRKKTYTATYVNGLLHSVQDKPSLVNKDMCVWHTKGIIDRENGPAVVTSDNYYVWFENGKKSRSFDKEKGIYSWFDENGLFHRQDLPAYITPTLRVWYSHGRATRKVRI